MDEETKRLHRMFAVDCFNQTWELIEKADRTHEDDVKMIHCVHASRFHWGEIGTPLEFARGDWQISRVYAVLGDGPAAFKYGQYSLNHCLENDIGDFDLAFAYEALARASALLGDKNKLEIFLKQANGAAQDIADEENKTYFLGELKTINDF